MEDKAIVGFLAEILRRIKGKFLQDDFYPFMRIGLDQLIDFGENMVNEIQQDIFMLLITVKVIELAQINREQDGVASRMLLDSGGIIAGGFLAADDLRWAGNAGCVNGQVGFVRTGKLIQP